MTDFHAVHRHDNSEFLTNGLSGLKPLLLVGFVMLGFGSAVVSAQTSPGTPSSSSTVGAPIYLPPPASTIPASVTIDLGPAPGPVQTMQAFQVSAGRARASEIEGPDPIDRYNPEYINASGAETVDEFLGTLPPPLGGTEQVVLVDGKPTTLDLSSIPVDMIEGLEVSRNGSMPEHGAFASGRVINIRLKKNYRGSKVKISERGSFAGGGEKHIFSFSGGSIKGKLRAIYSATITKNEGLGSLERASSRNQDHTARGGRDLRLLWGYPAVIQATEGSLDGLFDAHGLPISVALTPENQDGHDLTAAEFLPGLSLNESGSLTALGQRRFDTAPYLYLISPSRQAGANLSVNYTLSPRIEMSVTGSLSENRSAILGAPPVTPVSDAMRVPAAYNPFGQDVKVGLVHLEFGPTRRASKATSGQIGVNLNGEIGDRWKWHSGVAYSRSNSTHTITDLDQNAFALSLSNPDPARRFNPFTSGGAASPNAELYRDLTVNRESNNTSETSRFDFKTNGPIADIWSGPLQLALGGNYSEAASERRTQNVLSRLSPDRDDRSSARSLFTSFTVPLLTPPDGGSGRSRLELQLSGRYSNRDNGGAKENKNVGLTWTPMKSVLLRATWAGTDVDPSQKILSETDTLVGVTLIDPRRTPAAVSDVQVITRDRVETSRERTERQTVGVTVEPSLLPGLRFSADHTIRTQQNVLQRSFDPQDVVNNEAVLSGRVERLAPSSLDALLGQPGAIVAVDTSPGNAGETEMRDIDFSLEYRLPWEHFGKFQVSASADWILESHYFIQPGVAWVTEGADAYTPPAWSGRGQVRWSDGEWTASTSIRYSGDVENVGVSGFETPASTTVDIRAGYDFKRPLLGRLGKDLRVSAGITNLFDEDPAFADTLSGYRGISPLGRGYEVSFSLQL